MASDVKIATVLFLGGMTIVLQVLVNVWGEGLIMARDVVSPSLPGALCLAAIAASTAAALYIARPSGAGQTLMFGSLYAAAMLVGGMVASLTVLASWGIGF
jgi:hypothetical protein